MKQGWKITVFDDCINKVKVTTKLPSSSYKKEGAYPIVSQEKELISGYWDNAEDVIHSDIPVTIFGDHTMVVKYVDFDFVVGADGVKILQPKTFLLPKFFYYWVKSVDIPSRGYARHYRYLRENNVPIPTIAEQERIVEILDREFEKIDALKANAERSLQQAKDLFQSALKQELQPKEGWVTMKLGEFAHMKAGDFVKASDIKESSFEGSVPCYGGNGLRGYVKEANRDGEFCLIGRQGALCGNIHIASGVFRATEHAVVVSPYQKMPIKLVYYLLVSLNLNQYSTGAAQPGLSVRNIADNVNIAIPPQADWNVIANKLGALKQNCQALEENYIKTMALCDDMKQALLRQAFNGEL